MITIGKRVDVAPDGKRVRHATSAAAGEHEADPGFIEDRDAASRSNAATLLARVRAIQEEVGRLPVLDCRSPDEIIGYDERGHCDWRTK